MKSFVRVLIAVLLVISITVALVGSAALEKKPVIIGFKHKPGQADKDMVRGHGGDIKYSYSIINAVSAKLPEQAIEALKKAQGVDYVELDGTVHILADTLPWGVDRIDAELVHPYNKGTGVKVAIIDTGIDYTHSDLDGNYKGGYNFVSGNADPKDDNGHGTHVAGTVAAENNGFGVIGVAPEASLYAVKVLDSTGSGTFSNVIAGIDWSVNNGMQVISMSLGANEGSISLKNAVDNAYSSGVVVVAAAGNDGNSAGTTDTVDYPARYDSVIAVAATDSSNTRASFSSTGPAVEVSAPGVSVYSTIPGGYGYKSGTSMATPHVTGTAALIIASNPNLTNVEVRQILRNTSTDLGDPGNDIKYGYGLINANKAAPMKDTTPPEQVTGVTVMAAGTNELYISWNASTEPDISYYRLYRSSTPGFAPISGNLIASVSVNSYSDTGLSASTTYYYLVTAVDSSGNEGPQSVESSGTTYPDTIGPATENVAANRNPTNGATLVTLKATADDTATGNSNIMGAEFFTGSEGDPGTGISMSAIDGAFSSPVEEITAVINVSGFAPGSYKIYVHGRDAADNWGAAGSITLNITEAPVNTMHVADIVMSKTTQKVKGKYYTYATAVVSIVDVSGVPVQGATVSGNWSGSISGTGTGITDASGKVSLKSGSVKTTAGTFTFTVSGVTKNGWTYDPGANIVTSKSTT